LVLLPNAQRMLFLLIDAGVAFWLATAVRADDYAVGVEEEVEAAAPASLEFEHLVAEGPALFLVAVGGATLSQEVDASLDDGMFFEIAHLESGQKLLYLTCALIITPSVDSPDPLSDQAQCHCLPSG
jgi:hypothetical protein